MFDTDFAKLLVVKNHSDDFRAAESGHSRLAISNSMIFGSETIFELRVFADVFAKVLERLLFLHFMIEMKPAFGQHQEMYTRFNEKNKFNFENVYETRIHFLVSSVYIYLRALYKTF